VSEPGPRVHINVGVNGREILGVSLSAYSNLFIVLREQGFPIMGATFVIDPEELGGLRPPEFRAAGPAGGWLVWDVWQKWRQIAVGAGKSDKMSLMDVASRIASGLTYSQMRVRDLAAAYSTQLRGCLHNDEAKEYRAFKDINSYEVYKTIHALFWQLAVLRDTLAEFAAAFCFSRPQVTSLKGLLKSLRQDPVPGDPIAAEILQSGDKSGGWLARFSSYRNFFTHVAPLEQAMSIAFTVQDLRALPSGLKMPQIYYPLPEDVEDLMRRRSSGPLFGSMKELATALRRQHDRGREPDALEYLHGCLNQLAELALKLTARSPMAPKPIHLTAEDMVGGVRISRRTDG